MLVRRFIFKFFAYLEIEIGICDRIQDLMKDE